MRVVIIHAGSGDTIRSFQKTAPYFTVRGLLLQYFNIAFLMGTPQDLPGGRLQMQTGIALALVTYVLALAVPFGVGRAFLQALIELSSTAFLIWMALNVVGQTARFEQAFGGLCGASAFINLAALPLYALRPPPTDAANMPVGTLADFVLMVWGLSLIAHVIRHTFEVRMVVSILISFIYILVLSTVLALFIPMPTVEVEEALSFLSHYSFSWGANSASASSDTLLNWWAAT